MWPGSNGTGINGGVRRQKVVGAAYTKNKGKRIGRRHSVARVTAEAGGSALA